MKSLLKASIAFFLVMIAVLAAVLTYRWERERLQETVSETSVPDLPNLPDTEVTADTETRLVEIFYFQPSQNRPGKVVLKSTTEHLVKRPNPAATALFAARTSLDKSGFLVGKRAGVDQIFLLEDGTAIVDLARRTSGYLQGSVASELGLLRAIARTLTANLESVERVRFILGGQEMETLAGHVSLATVFR